MNLPLNVVVIADFAVPSGGAQAVAIRSALSLAGRGVRTTYIHGVDQPPDDRLRAAGVDVVSLRLADIWTRPAATAAVAGIWDREAARRLRAALADRPAGSTVLHLHQWTRSLSPSALPTLRTSGHPVTVTLHDYFAACPNGVYYRFERQEPCTLRPLSAPCLAAPCDPRSRAHKAVRVVRTLATRAAMHGAAFDVIHVSDRGRDTITPFLPAGLRHHRIDNPVEIAQGEPAAIGSEAAIAYLGRLTTEKGADLVAAAADRAGMPVLFVGEGPAEAAIRQLNPTAAFLGWRSRDDVAALLRRKVRAVAAPSRWFETGPLTVYEALASGVTAVASSRSGAAEKVRHGETGFVVPPDVDALAAAFRALADDDVARRMGRAAYGAYWARPLSPDAHADQLICLYEDLLARRTQPSAVGCGPS